MMKKSYEMILLLSFLIFFIILIVDLRIFDTLSKDILPYVETPVPAFYGSTVVNMNEDTYVNLITKRLFLYQHQVEPRQRNDGFCPSSCPPILSGTIDLCLMHTSNSIRRNDKKQKYFMTFRRRYLRRYIRVS